MKKTTITLISALVLPIGTTHATENGHWGYSGNVSPEHWGSLDPSFGVCSTGTNQSPINIENFIDADLKKIIFDYQANTTDFVNNGHTVQVNFDSGSTISLEGKSYELKQLHFHTPSENLIHGKSFPMEAHFVHANNENELAVIGILFEEGNDNEALASLLAIMPQQVDDRESIDGLNIMSILPTSKDYYRYNGSLTTPPCTEGVRWIVMKDSVQASAQQLNAFKKVMHENNRPVQPKKARPILE